MKFLGGGGEGWFGSGGQATKIKSFWSSEEEFADFLPRKRSCFYRLYAPTAISLPYEWQMILASQEPTETYRHTDGSGK